MSRRPWLFIAGLAIAAIASFVLRDLIREVVIIPLAHLWWLIGLYYRAIPQLIVWGILIFIVFTATIQNMLLPGRLRKQKQEARGPIQGPAQKLSELLEKTKKGNYYRWQVANRLGNIAREILEQRRGLSIKKGFVRIAAQGLKMPKEAETYLETGLNGSFADYPQPRWWSMYPQSTPLDIDPKKIIDYLEHEMEIKHDRDR